MDANNKKFADDLLKGGQYAIKEICLDYINMLKKKSERGEDIKEQLNDFINNMILKH